MIRRENTRDQNAGDQNAVYQNAGGDHRPFGVKLWLACALIAAILLYWTGALRLIFPGEDSAPSAGFRLLHFAFYGLYLMLLASDWRRVMACLRGCPLLVLFMALPVLSVAWSTMPTETLQRAVAVTGSSLLGLYLAIALKARDAMRIVAFAAFLGAIGSFITIVAVPSVGVMTVEHPGAWAGLYTHKNGLGQMAALGALLASAVLLADGTARNQWALVSLGLNVVLVAGSRSLTALILLVVVACALIVVGRFLHFIVRYSVVIGIALLLAVIAAAANFRSDDVFVWLEAAGKDGNLSSRLPMWQALIPFIEDRFWLGWGYEAFWHEANYAVHVIEAKLFFRPYYAHNGIIELWLSLGVLGVAIFLAVFSQFVWRTLRRLYAGQTGPVELASFAFAVIFVLQNISESTILMRNTMSWTLFIMFYLSIAQARARSAEPAFVTDVQVASAAAQGFATFAQAERKPRITVR